MRKAFRGGSSERQLDDSHGPILFLYVLMLEAQEGGLATLPALVAQVRAALGELPAAREAFEDALLAARYLDLHAHRYAATGYAVRQADTFRVGPGFPRIIERDLSPGVGDASYLLSLAACTDFVAPTESIVAALLTPM
ncbi:MAG: PD-(D/E)XK motif protein [Opitutus sp.]|nr:PD-(D/E)XK motif protein [Opitutus sp.]MCS6278374.1 PD-(D/E)XK motif protein [Opitutus sp.]MCS6299484.1 PD-(D/E)XK motif protein [Opitutus sp.]